MGTGMILQWVKHILILPGTILVYIPAAILWLVADRPGAIVPAGPGQVRFWIGIALAATGLVLSTGCARLFVSVGRGTPAPWAPPARLVVHGPYAPWAPPARLVVHGPYRHVRNPMIASVLFLLGAESLLLGSWHLAGWMAVFFLLKTLYFLRFEEPGLEGRFGDSYRRYKANVPRWIPRLRPWDPEG